MQVAKASCTQYKTMVVYLRWERLCFCNFLYVKSFLVPISDQRVCGIRALTCGSSPSELLKFLVILPNLRVSSCTHKTLKRRLHHLGFHGEQLYITHQPNHVIQYTYIVSGYTPREAHSRCLADRSRSFVSMAAGA